MSTIELNDKKVINGWAFFDWANSAYFLVISTAVFPIFYTGLTNGMTVNFIGREMSNSALYSFAVSFAYLVIALASPVLSGMADYSGRRMKYLKIFTIAGSLACIALFFFDTEDKIWFGIAAFIVATIGASGGIVFYNAYLPEIASEDQYDRVSAKGYAYGYIGSVMLLVFCLFMINSPQTFGISPDNTLLAPRISFLLVGIWWIGFAQITFNRLPKDSPIANPGKLVRKGIRELLLVWNKVKKNPNTLKFLSSFFFYSAGVQTVIYLATIFASKELEFGTTELIITILIIQVIAIGGAYLFALVSKIWGNKLSLITMILIWMVICAGAYFVEKELQFYILSGLVGMVLGGIQSLSRSSYSKLLDDVTEDLTSYFSFYDVLYKVSIVAGAAIFGIVEILTGGLRNSVLALGVFFLIGVIIMTQVTFDPRKLKPSSQTA